MTAKLALRRYELLREIGCIACRIAGNPTPCGRIEMHHLVDKGNRALSGGDLATVPLGEWHHQGTPFIDKTVKYMRLTYGPSMRLEKRLFTSTYGTQRELLRLVNESIDADAAA